MTKKVLQTEQAPKAIGPYSQGVAYKGETIVVSGQGSLQEAISQAKPINR